MGVDLAFPEIPLWSLEDAASTSRSGFLNVIPAARGSAKRKNATVTDSSDSWDFDLTKRGIYGVLG